MLTSIDPKASVPALFTGQRYSVFEDHGNAYVAAVDTMAVALIPAGREAEQLLDDCRHAALRRSSLDSVIGQHTRCARAWALRTCAASPDMRFLRFFH